MTLSLPSRATCALITVAASVGLSACSLNDDPSATSSSEPSSVAESAVESSTSVALDYPVTEMPQPDTDRTQWNDCPYLDAQWVAETNGQRVLGVGLDSRFDPPACVFWSYADEPQLQVLVRHLPTEDDAIAMVDHFAPIDVTDPADLPGGWMGGRAGGGVVEGAPGALFAVSSGETAVVVLTNQDQSVKAQLIAEEVIANLGL